ncbi:MAG TPA: GNAT family protein [Caulobacteraceae bacterium]|jgi:RimJ/RimL family protein N-acetyltransferase
MELGGVVLQGRHVRLEPLGEAHREPLRTACAADHDIWTLYPYSMTGGAFDAYWSRAVERNASGAGAVFAILSGAALVGVSGFGPDRANRTTEIGGTYLHPSARGGPVNPEAKRLMLGHAFDQGARRVQFRVDALNQRSAAAMRKLGAHQDGMLRQDQVTWTGRVRDTLIFSILDHEWPQVRDRLDERLRAFA